jgi:hypothetical protein
MKQQALAGDIVLLFADESEALTHPYLSNLVYNMRRFVCLERMTAGGRVNRRATRWVA